MIFVLALAVWGGMGRGGSDKGEKLGDATGAQAGRVPSFGERKTPSERAGGRPQRERPADGGSDMFSNVRDRSLNALRSQDPVARMSAFLRIISSCNATDLQQVRDAIAELKATGMPLGGEEELLHFRAGQLDGADLLAERTGTAEDFAEIGNLKQQYEGWIQADTYSAGHWLNQLPPGKFRDQMAVAYIAASTQDDPQGAMNLVATLHPSQQAAAGGAVVTSSTTEDASAVLRELEGNSDNAASPYLETMFTALASKVANGSDPEAVALVEERLDKPYVTNSALMLISAAKAKFDPKGALDWAVEMESRKPETLNYGQMVSSVIQAMSLENLDKAEIWAATQPDAENLLRTIEGRKEKLQDRVGEDNEYDKDD
ncbi:hypothetical protein ACFSSA_10915 [Luteolibacter algae]|uniref:HEAT repeat domain-containing protein n=1 Tax=Luteolibacter algae TaxID=454151 RepID=A0ABW5D7Y9_9BACT